MFTVFIIIIVIIILLFLFFFLPEPILADRWKNRKH